MNQEADKSPADPSHTVPEAITEQLPEDNPEKEPVISEISAFFENPDISPSVFFKTLKANKVKRFKSDDVQKSLSAIKNDFAGARLWALMSQAKLPDAVDRWIWPIAQERLKLALGLDINSMNADPTQILRDIHKILSSRLASKDKIEAKSAENWLRIGICWLAEKRSIELWTIAEVISLAFYNDTKKSKSAVHRAISKGSIKELKLSAATAALGKDIVARSKSDLASERQISDGLRIQLNNRENTIKSLSDELAATREELAQKSEALENVENDLKNERHHRGHELAEMIARQRVLLNERVAPLLSDAVDALEIEPPVPHLSLRRIKSVLKIIEDDSA